MRMVIAVIAASVALAAATPAAAVSDPEKAVENCKQAEERYQEIFGKPSAEEPVTIVLMYKYTFCPVHLTVKQGTTVRWVNVDKRTSHSYWFKDAGKEESARLFPDEIAEMTFDLPPGEYPYLCGPHWESDDMRGTVTVTE
ncbi:MAG: cupredoxin domain-containing protein [Hyphomicrobiales bacterium]|nr:cupredoxin domain-containing protein [Hyphomicrobiales bacterium]